MKGYRIMNAKAILFDLDGVITDTARYHFLAWKHLCDELGLTFTEADNEHLKGIDRLNSLEIILSQNAKSDVWSDAEKERLAARKNGYYQQLLEQLTPADILPGIPEFLSQCRQHGCRTAVASVSRNVRTVLDGIGLSDMFDFVADPGQIKKNKPDPEIFLCCASALGLSPVDCVGIDDSVAGIRAIRAAGMFAIGIGIPSNAPCRQDLSLHNTCELPVQACKILFG